MRVTTIKSHSLWIDLKLKRNDVRRSLVRSGALAIINPDTGEPLVDHNQITFPMDRSEIETQWCSSFFCEIWGLSNHQSRHRESLLLITIKSHSLWIDLKLKHNDVRPSLVRSGALAIINPDTGEPLVDHNQITFPMDRSEIETQWCSSFSCEIWGLGNYWSRHRRASCWSQSNRILYGSIWNWNAMMFVVLLWDLGPWQLLIPTQESLLLITIKSHSLWIDLKLKHNDVRRSLVRSGALAIINPDTGEPLVDHNQITFPMDRSEIETQWCSSFSCEIWGLSNHQSRHRRASCWSQSNHIPYGSIWNWNTMMFVVLLWDLGP